MLKSLVAFWFAYLIVKYGLDALFLVVTVGGLVYLVNNHVYAQK